MCEKIFEETDYKTDTAESGERAIEKFRRKPYDVVFPDLKTGQKFINRKGREAMYELRLYLAGKQERSRKITEDLKALLDASCDGPYILEVIDVLETPHIAESDKILATPTLAKLHPEPVRRVLGDLRDPEKVLTALGLARAT
jgi:circadian clock protein KaiB